MGRPLERADWSVSTAAPGSHRIRPAPRPITNHCESSLQEKQYEAGIPEPEIASHLYSDRQAHSASSWPRPPQQYSNLAVRGCLRVSLRGNIDDPGTPRVDGFESRTVRGRGLRCVSCVLSLDHRLDRQRGGDVHREPPFAGERLQRLIHIWIEVQHHALSLRCSSGGFVEFGAKGLFESVHIGPLSRCTTYSGRATGYLRSVALSSFTASLNKCLILGLHNACFRTLGTQMRLLNDCNISLYILYSSIR